MNRTYGMGRVRELRELREKIEAGHRGRIEFVADLARTVADLRKRFRDENRAVHAAWFGPTRAEQAKVARIKEAAKAARVKEAAAAIAAAAAAVRIKEAGKNALVKAAAKAVPVKGTKKPAKKVRGR